MRVLVAIGFWLLLAAPTVVCEASCGPACPEELIRRLANRVTTTMAIAVARTGSARGWFRGVKVIFATPN